MFGGAVTINGVWASRGEPIMGKRDLSGSALSGSGSAALLGLVLVALLVWAPSAGAQTQTSGALILGPDCCQISHSPPQAGDSVGTPNQTIHITVNIQSTSQIGGVFVDANVLGTTTVILGCTSSATNATCTGTELGALTFDSCTPAAGVSSCVAGGNPNHVLITYPAGGKLVTTVQGGTLLATITAHFTSGQAVLNGSTANGHVASEGQFFLLGDSGDGNLQTAAASGSAGGSAPLFFPGFCGDGIVDPTAGE